MLIFLLLGLNFVLKHADNEVFTYNWKDNVANFVSRDEQLVCSFFFQSLPWLPQKIFLRTYNYFYNFFIIFQVNFCNLINLINNNYYYLFYNYF